MFGNVFTTLYRAKLYAERGYATVRRLSVCSSVCLSLCPSVCDVQVCFYSASA